MSGILAGCAPYAHDAPAAQGRDSTINPAIPLALSGQDTLVRLAFSRHDQTVEPGQFQKDELCYLKAGEFRIDCYSDGSSMNLGPTDSNDLLTDNPMWIIGPADGSQLSVEVMKLYGVIFLIGGSLDRVPGALADYIQSPGQHLGEAVALAEVLLSEKRVQFQGYARGGNFTVAVELTDSGRDKLTDALDEVGEPSGSTQFVTHRQRKTARSAVRPIPADYRP